MTAAPGVCVITPTVRNPGFIEAYVRNAEENGFDTDRLFVLMVTEDFCDTDGMRALLDRLGVEGAVFGGKERDAWYEERGVGAYSDVVPSASHAETSFGLLYLWDRPGFEYGVFLDDDTAPHPDFDFFGTHLDQLGTRRTVEHVSSDERWVNVLYQNADEHGLYPRGYPYSAMDETIETETKETDEIVASQGLWTNIPDLDAVRILMDGDLKGQAQTLTKKEDFTHSFAAAEGNFLTVCSMNLAFKREIVPAFYQFPMDDNEWGIGRFDDIWSGLTLKKAADMLDKSLINGFPLCEHNKAERSTFSDLTNEAPALELNEHFWEALAAAPDEADDYADAYEEMISAVEAYDFSEYDNAEFIEFAVEKMERWLVVLNELQSEK
ncbi:alpha-1 4-glucan-protein synthase [Natronomonas sp. F2-12]|uniref:Alpha-1 4-glucan-protein synthase n=1 Tax=Natronomonas aquatica TaxID=2841590 RepID=A0A9R1CNZ9_9EURY|nr:alpha-1 4-glucan-protein synthase [Natronomonas aquatica]MCQ4332329.1 alpha-1 4-glucan-protein synthase [Natronomonas aquatica]